MTGLPVRLAALCSAVLVPLAAAACSSGASEQIAVVSGQNMRPTLQPGDRLVVDPKRSVTRGVIIEFKMTLNLPRNPELTIPVGATGPVPTPGPVAPRSVSLISRVVGLPGEVISVMGNAVRINGTLLSEPYLAVGTPSINLPTIHIGPNQYFVMGDNRTDSEDSRFFGPITAAQVIGVVVRATTSAGRTENLG